MKIFEYEKVVKQEKGKRFLALSDIHVADKRDIKKLLILKKTILKRIGCYDAIFLVGDIIDSTNVLRDGNKVYEELLSFIKFLGEIAPTYIAFGAHDMCYFDIDRAKDHELPWVADIQVFLDKFVNVINNFYNLQVFSNDTIEIGDGYSISILNPILDYYLRKKDGDEFILLNSKECEFLKKLDSSLTNILLCHDPKAVLTLYNHGLLNNVDISVSGHTHNGMTQLKLFPLESILNILHQNNRGIITPSKSFNTCDTKYLRGNVLLNDNQNIIINPAFVSLSKCAGKLHYFDNLFYRGASEINLVPKQL